MGKETKITCDNCESDLTDSGSMPRYRLHLSAERMRNKSNVECAVIVYPPIERDLYFCGMKCLREHI